MNKKKKLKLTKLTISNLDAAKGGRPPKLCICDALVTDGAYNRDHYTEGVVTCPNICP
jgi:hypothetical protein